LIPATGKVGANRTNTTPPGVFCGTDGSNPLSSSEESANHRFPPSDDIGGSMYQHAPGVQSKKRPVNNPTTIIR